MVENMNTILGKYLTKGLGQDVIGHKFESTAEFSQWIYSRILTNELVYLVVGVVKSMCCLT
jgi:hypothetical protein